MSAPRSARLIADLFAPHPVQAWSATASINAVAELVGAETEALTPMVTGRRAEYATGRACARAALANLPDVAADAAIRRDDRGAPIWPDSTTGSISHTEGFCAAVAARISPDLVAIGLDIERVERVGPRVRRRILTEAEGQEVAELPDDEAQLRTAIAFAAKEAFYKAQYQITSTYLGFGAVSVRVAGDTFSFASDHDVVASFVDDAQGRLVIDDGRVIAAVAVHGPSPEAASHAG